MPHDSSTSYLTLPTVDDLLFGTDGTVWRLVGRVPRQPQIPAPRPSARPVRPRPSGQGTVRGSQCHAHKLIESDIPIIFAMARDGMSQRKIGAHFGVDQATINVILRGKGWRHAAPPSAGPTEN